MSDKGSINNITLPVYKKLKAECSVVRTETDITELSDTVLSKLKCGDIVCKEDASGKHSYIVSYKKDGVGICLTYADGSGYIETVSYDFTDGHWVYNSTDVFSADDRIKLLVEGGTLENAKPIYWHNLHLERLTAGSYPLIADLVFLTNSSTPITSSEFMNYLSREGFLALAISGRIGTTGYDPENPSIPYTLSSLEYDSNLIFKAKYYDTNGLVNELLITISNIIITDKVNKIN